MKKVMFAGVGSGVLWEMATEQEVPADGVFYRRLNEELNLERWKENYSFLYHRWLEKDDAHIYDLSNPVNSDMINAIKKFNAKINLNELYYWFDVDRNINPDFRWTFCPLSGEKLVLLPEPYHENNRLISPSEPLVFPL